MRAVIFFGLACIAEAIGNETGWSGKEVDSLGAILFSLAMALDLYYAFVLKK